MTAAALKIPALNTTAPVADVVPLEAHLSRACELSAYTGDQIAKRIALAEGLARLKPFVSLNGVEAIDAALRLYNTTAAEIAPLVSGRGVNATHLHCVDPSKHHCVDAGSHYQHIRKLIERASDQVTKRRALAALLLKLKGELDAPFQAWVDQLVASRNCSPAYPTR